MPSSFPECGEKSIGLDREATQLFGDRAIIGSYPNSKTNHHSAFNKYDQLSVKQRQLSKKNPKTTHFKKLSLTTGRAWEIQPRAMGIRGSFGGLAQHEVGRDWVGQEVHIRYWVQYTKKV